MKHKTTFYIIAKICTYVVVFLLISCGKERIPAKPQHIENGLKISEIPFSASADAVRFHENIVYGIDERNVYDFFKPNQEKAASLLILLHGGGFVTGDKSKYYDSYRYRGFIDRLLEKNIAVAAVNYRYLTPENDDGIINSLHDVKRALQHMRHYADSLHFDAEKVMIYGTSAGGAAAMWIAFQDEMAQQDSNDIIEKQSTRIQGIVAISTQANYDIVNWHDTVFSSFQTQGFGQDAIVDLLKDWRISLYYGLKSLDSIPTKPIQEYVQKTNTLPMLSADDPEFYLFTDDFSAEVPETMSALFHHPYHLKTIREQAEKVNAKGVYYCPQLNVDTTNGESYEEFIIRKIGN
jgi:hypothetical protein